MSGVTLSSSASFERSVLSEKPFALYGAKYWTFSNGSRRNAQLLVQLAVASSSLARLIEEAEVRTLHVEADGRDASLLLAGSA